VQPVSHGAAVTWTATLVVPLVDGGDAEFDLASAAPIVNAKAAGVRVMPVDATPAHLAAPDDADLSD